MTGRAPESTSLYLVRRYLTATGWQIGMKGGSYDLYTHRTTDNDQLELFVAKSEEVRGWRASVRDALETLAGLTAVSMESMASTVRSIAYDVIRATLPNELIRDDSIDLDLASAFIWRSKRLLAASATAEIVQTQYYKKTRKVAERYAGSCRFGHTFRGSFGFTLESPLSETQKQAVMDGLDIEGLDIAPFERRVVERFARGLSLIEEAARRGDPEILAASYETGWNANVCHEFLKLHEAAKGAAVQFSLSWSPELSPRPDLATKLVFAVPGNAIEVIQDAAALLIERQEEQVEVVSGLVIELRSEHIGGSLVEPEGDIVVRWKSEEYGNIKVHMRLPMGWYALAYEAHGAGKAVVAQGIFEKSGKFWWLSRIESFSIRY